MKSTNQGRSTVSHRKRVALCWVAVVGLLAHIALIIFCLFLPPDPFASLTVLGVFAALTIVVATSALTLIASEKKQK